MEIHNSKIQTLKLRGLRILTAATILSALATSQALGANNVECLGLGAGVSVYEGQSGSVSIYCGNYTTFNIVPDKIFITETKYLGDVSDKAFITSSVFNYGNSTHPGIVWSAGPLAEHDDSGVNLVFKFSTPPADVDEIIDSGTTLIRGFFTYDYLDGSGSNGSLPFAATIVVMDSPVPEPDTWVLMLTGFIALGFASHRRSQDDEASTITTKS